MWLTEPLPSAIKVFFQFVSFAVSGYRGDQPAGAGRGAAAGGGAAGRGPGVPAAPPGVGDQYCSGGLGARLRLP